MWQLVSGRRSRKDQWFNTLEQKAAVRRKSKVTAGHYFLSFCLFVFPTGWIEMLRFQSILLFPVRLSVQHM